MLPDGTAFRFSEEKSDTAQELSRGVTVSGSLADTTSAASTDSVTQNNAESNTDFSEGAQRFSMDEPVEEAGNEDTVFTEDAVDDWLDMEQDAGYNEQTENAEGGVNYGREMGDNPYRGRDAALSGERSAEGTGQHREGEGALPGEGRARGDRGENLLREDSEGRRLTEEEAEKLAGTAIVDNEGHPLAVYHFTPEMDFETFERGDIGFRFGTQEQADQRGKDLKAETGRMFRAY